MYLFYQKDLRAFSLTGSEPDNVYTFSKINVGDVFNSKEKYSQNKDGEILFITKKPMWNSEINTYVHNFGCRVKKASNRNFIVIQSVADASEATDSQNAMRNTSTFDSTNSISIRHGKVTESEYVLDFRGPISPLVALASICAAYSDKFLVATGP